MIPHEVFELQAEICKAMSHAARLKIIHALRAGPKRVCDIAQITGLAPSQASQHLAVLRGHALVVATREGRDVAYAIANPQLLHICDSMREMLADQAHKFSEVAQAM